MSLKCFVWRMYPGRGTVFCGPVEVRLVSVSLYLTLSQGVRGSPLLCHRGLCSSHRPTPSPSWDLCLRRQPQVKTLTQRTFPDWSFRLFRNSQNKSKSSLLLPLVPVMTSSLAGLVIILPCTGVFVEVDINHQVNRNSDGNPSSALISNPSGEKEASLSTAWHHRHHRHHHLR